METLMATLFLNYDPFEGGFEIRVGNDTSIKHIYTSYGSLLFGFGDDDIRSGTFDLTTNHVRLESTQIVQTATECTIWFCLDDDLPKPHWIFTPKSDAILYLIFRRVQNAFTGRACKVVGGISIDVPEEFQCEKPFDKFIATYVERPGDNVHRME
jgi:hypothetical protein